MGFGKMITNISIKLRIGIFSVVLMSYGFTGFAGKCKIHETDIWLSSAACLDSMGGEHSQTNSDSRLGEFIITDEGIGPIQLGYQFRDFVDFFNPDNIKLYRSEPEGVGWVT